MSARLPSQLRAWHLSNMEIHFNEDGEIQKVTVPPSCYSKLGNSSLPLYKVNSTLVNRIQSAEPDPTCYDTHGDFFFVSDIQGRATENIFDELSTLWFHIWLLNRHLCKRNEPPRWRLLYMDDILNGMPTDWHQRYDKMLKASDTGPPFQNILTLFGDYVPWPSVISKAKTSGKGCIRFPRAVTTPSSWLWLDKAIPAYSNSALQEFVDAILETYGLGGPRRSRCNYKLLYATRRGMKARRVINELQVLKTIEEAAPDFEVRSVNLGELTFKEQLQEVSSADVFVFPHGGAGPHVLFLPHGAAVIELFPYADADPMYRNLAVQTGKSYFIWQASRHANPNIKLYDPHKINTIMAARHIYHFSNESNFFVDAKALRSLVLSATFSVRNSLGTNWFPSHGGEFSAFLCTICHGPEGRKHTCDS